jgi:hypothetical protein
MVVALVGDGIKTTVNAKLAFHLVQDAQPKIYGIKIVAYANYANHQLLDVV